MTAASSSEFAVFYGSIELSSIIKREKNTVFEIALKQQQYLTYILWDQQAQSRLEIVPERGGMVSAWRIRDQYILYMDTERFANPDSSVRGGIPILFPICGNLPDNVYTHNGQQYTLKRHGFARDLPWEVAEKGTQEDCASLTLVLNSNEQTRAVYPFDFQLTFTYVFAGNTLKIQQRYTNHSAETMPFSVGLHPYFWTPEKSQLAFDIPASQSQDQNTGEVHPFGTTFNLSRDEIDVALRPLSREFAFMSDRHRGLKITLIYSDLYSTLVFWTVKGKQYCCLEPWSSPRNALNTGEQLLSLEPGASYEAWVEISVSDL